MKEKYLITGSRGSIGSKLVDALPDADIIRGDRLCEFVPKVDHVVDLAAYGNTSGHAGEIYEIYRANVLRPISLLTAIRRNSPDCKSIVLTSSSSVLLEQQTHYSLSKKVLEALALKMADEFKLPIVIIRPATVTGPGEDLRRLIPKLIDSCLNGTEMPFVAEPTHDYVDVRDVVDAILMLSHRSPEVTGRVFNLSSNKSTSNQEVLEIVEKLTGKKANLKMVGQMRAYDNKNWVVDNSEMLKLGWSLRYSLEDSVRNMIENYGH